MLGRSQHSPSTILLLVLASLFMGLPPSSEASRALLPYESVILSGGQGPCCSLVCLQLLLLLIKEGSAVVCFGARLVPLECCLIDILSSDNLGYGQQSATAAVVKRQQEICSLS
jgi:hypothetical protein